MKINQFAILTFILFLFTGNQLMAQQSFNLVQAQEYALKNNVNNKNAMLDIDIAQQKIWETTAFGLPQINGKIAYQNIFEVPVMNFNGNEIPLGVQENWTYTLTASQLIFNGSYIVGLKTSKTYSKLSAEALAKTEIEIKENIANSYYMILTLEEGKKSLDSSFANMQKTFYEMSEMCKFGFIEDTDTDQMQLNVSNLKNSILSVSNQILLSYKLLKYQMGMKFSDSIILTDNLDDMISQIKAQELIATPFDLNSNVNYQLLETQEKLSYLNMQFERSKTLPSIAAFYQYQKLGTEPAFNFTPPNVFGLSVEIPIISGGGRYAKINQSKLALEKMSNTKSQVAEGLQMEALQARSDLQVAFDKYITEKNNLELSKRIYFKTLTKYKEGVSSSLDLTQANNQFLLGLTNYYQVVMKLLSAKTKMEKILTKN